MWAQGHALIGSGLGRVVLVSTFLVCLLLDNMDCTEKLIRTVKSKPPLYDKTLKEYSDRNVVKKLWAEVCEVMVEKWNDLTPQEKIIKVALQNSEYTKLDIFFTVLQGICTNVKNLTQLKSDAQNSTTVSVPAPTTTFLIISQNPPGYALVDKCLFYQLMVDFFNKAIFASVTQSGKDLQQRWRNLRTCFTRELQIQKKTKSGQGAKKRRKYIYFDQLRFLLPTVSVKKVTTPREKDAEQDIKNVELVDDEEQLVPPPKKKTASYEEQLINILREKEDDSIDEDKSFLLSLVPAFRRFTEEQKIEAKVAFLNTIKRISHPPTYPYQYATVQTPHVHTPQHVVSHTISQHSNYYNNPSCSPQPLPQSSFDPLYVGEPSSVHSESSYIPTASASPKSELLDSD